MKKESLKKLLAFIITIMMFFVIPQVSNAQQKGHFCPPCYRWYKGHCVPCRGCCMRLSSVPSNDEASFASLSPSPVINFPLSGNERVSIKIYDVTGRLIKTLADNRMPQGENQIAWDKTDNKGNAVSTGIYILQFNKGIYSGTKKLSVN